MTPDYLFASSEDRHELERLGHVEREFDPITFGLMERVGVAPGWSCLEVGPGAGSVMRWLCDRVGDAGRVVAVDLDPRFVAGTSRPNLEVRRGDIALPGSVEPAAFDLIHTRCVLMHVRQQAAALANLVAGLKPGGVLLAEEPDFSAGPAVGSPEVMAAVGGVLDGMRRLYESGGADPYLGRKLPALFEAAGLRAVTFEARLCLARGGSHRSHMRRMAVEHLRERLPATGATDAAGVEAFLAASRDPAVWWLDFGTVSAWGRR